MAAATFKTRNHWSPILPCITALLLGVSLGQSGPCGPNSGVLCPENNCCNINKVCGNGTDYCSSATCASQCPQGVSRCGPAYAGAPCPPGSCCTSNSLCSGSIALCGGGNCSSQCPFATCGPFNGGMCPPGSCCNVNGYCGTGSGFCDQNCACLPPPPPMPFPGPFPIPAAPRSPPGLASTPPSGSSSKNTLAIVVGTSVGGFAFLAVCAVTAFFVMRSRRNRIQGLEKNDPSLQLIEMPERFSYKQLSVATRAFSEESKLGQGGFGSVYRGVLPTSGIAVAVKKISNNSSQGEKEFRTEVSIIGRLRHRNLIQLQGWCKDMPRERYLLVYELMPNGSLDKILFEKAENQTVCLSWDQRFNIVTGTAAAVDYLHQGWKQQVIHRDIKSSNIMLDQDWNAKLGDFGLARLVDHQRSGATTVVVGTYGYIAPEAATTGRFTDKTDVFAFGAVALEIACGRRAFSAELPPDEIILVDWVWERLSQNALLSTVDKRLVDYDRYWMEVVLMMGLLCSHPDPEARPSMQHVLEVLAGHVPIPPVPASKPGLMNSSNSLKVPSHSPRVENTSRSRSGSLSLGTSHASDSILGSTGKSSGTF